MSNFSDVAAFHDKYEVPTQTEVALLPDDVAQFRGKFIQEELDEFFKASSEGNLVEAIDALIDIVYVALGTADLMGLSEEQWEAHWAEVQRANMEKVRVASAADSKRGHSFDVKKPAGWKAPDHVKILEQFNVKQ